MVFAKYWKFFDIGVQNTFVYRWNFLLRSIFGIVPLVGTVFHRAVAGEFDGVLCMYHDQGLIPLKLHAFDSGVNVTLGLPFPRTSPDHGTAFDIVGRNRANPGSMRAAIELAIDLAIKRHGRDSAVKSPSQNLSIQP